VVSIAPNVQLGTQYAELIEIAHEQLKGAAHGSDITFAQLQERISDLADKLKITPSSAAAAKNRIAALGRDKLIREEGRSFDFIQAIKTHGIVVLDCRYLTFHRGEKTQSN
jgi:hypothetical protein